MSDKTLLYIGRSHLLMLMLAYLYAFFLWVKVAAKLIGAALFHQFDLLLISFALVIGLYWMLVAGINTLNTLLKHNTKILNPYLHISLLVVVTIAVVTAMFLSHISW